jgi:Fe2+ or Zn2+ uptake regulation protein
MNIQTTAEHGSAQVDHPAAQCSSPWRLRLHDVGMRWTRAVHAIWHVLHDADDALDHAQIMEGALRVEGAGVDRVTVYRSLSRLVEVGLVRRVAGDDRRWRFVMVRANPHAPVRGPRDAAAVVEIFQDCPACHRVTPIDDVLTDAPPAARRWFTQLVQAGATPPSDGATPAGKSTPHSPADRKLRMTLMAICNDCAAPAQRPERSMAVSA